MSRERFEIAREQYGKAVERLREALALDETAVVRDAVIQRFEFTFELAWKALFYWLREQGEQVPEIVRQVLQAGFRAKVIEKPDAWERIRDYRNETSHTYNEAKAIEVVGFVRSEAMAEFDALLSRIKAL